MSTVSIQSKLSIYVITLLFTALSIFLQVLPMETSEYFQNVLGITSTKFVYLTSTFFITYSFMQVPGGIFFDKFGLKLVLQISMGMVLLGTGLYWISRSSEMLVISRLISGLGCSVAYISAVYVAANYFPSNRLPILIGLIESASTLGSLVGTDPLRNMLNNWGWNDSGLAMVGFCGVLFVSTILAVSKLNTRKNSQQTSLLLAFRDAFLLLKNYRLILLFIYSFCTWLVIMSFAGYWLKEYLMLMHKYSEADSLHLVELYWTSFLIASLVIGFFTESFKAARINIVSLSGLGLLTYGLMAVPVVFNYSQILLVIVCGGISATGVILAFSLIPHLVDRKHSGSAIALNNTFIVLGGYFGQLLFGTALNHINVDSFLHIIHDPEVLPNYYSAMLIYVVVTLIAFIVALLFLAATKKHQKSKH